MIITICLCVMLGFTVFFFFGHMVLVGAGKVEQDPRAFGLYAIAIILALGFLR